MSLDQIIHGLFYLVSIFIIFIIGKFVYDKLNPRFKLKEELISKDNFAVALTIIGYYLGLVFVIGGTLIGPSSGLVEDIIDIFFYGILAIILLNIAGILVDKIILYKFDNVKEIIDDQNAGTGIIEAANYIANGLILYGAISGEGGDLVTALSFWLLGQVVLIVICMFYNLITPFDVHEHIEKDNVAVGVAFAGVVIAFGNIIRIGLEGDFISWQQNLTEFFGFIIFGIILLPLLRLATDKILLPGRKLTDELINQEKPNVGAGVIEAFSYIAASFIIGWII
jgi:uncharacterized membrane protein YjfL (UPF0719 family)